MEIQGEELNTALEGHKISKKKIDILNQEVVTLKNSESALRLETQKKVELLET